MRVSYQVNGCGVRWHVVAGRHAFARPLISAFRATFGALLLFLLSFPSRLEEAPKLVE